MNDIQTEVDSNTNITNQQNSNTDLNFGNEVCKLCKKIERRSQFK